MIPFNLKRIFTTIFQVFALLKKPNIYYSNSNYIILKIKQYCSCTIMVFVRYLCQKLIDRNYNINHKYPKIQLNQKVFKSNITVKPVTSNISQLLFKRIPNALTAFKLYKTNILKITIKI